MTPAPTLEKPKTINKGHPWGKRHIVIALGFLGTAIACSIQNSLSLAIVPMTSGSKYSSKKEARPLCEPLSLESNSSERAVRKELEVLNLDLGFWDGADSFDEKEAVEFDWSEKEQGIMLGAFFWGYVTTLYLGGYLAHKLGGKWIFSSGVVASGLCSLLLPVATISWGKWGLVLVRVGQGLAQGLTCPAIQVVLAKWSGTYERSRFANFVYSGYPFGSAASLIGGGYLIKYYQWPAFFYVTGGLSILWFVAWSYFVSSCPSSHPSISEEERSFIVNGEQELSQKHPKTPWRDILTSLEVWAIFTVQIGQFWGKNIIQIEMPKYLATVHGLRIQNIGWIAAVPQFLNCIFGMFVASLSDWLIKREFTSVEFTRKLCALIVGLGSSGAFIGMGFGACDTIFALSCLLLGGVVSGASRGSWMVNMIDIAPNHAGTIMALGSIASYFLGMVTPYVTGVILHVYRGLLGWKIVFVVGAVTNFSVSIFYLKFAKGTEANWNKIPNEEAEDNNNRC